MKHLPLLATLIVVYACSPARAFPRDHYEDETVVERSALIVIAAVKADTLYYVPHPQSAGVYVHEYHLFLKVSRVLKGDQTATEIPVIIQRGIDPIIPGQMRSDGSAIRRLWVIAPLQIYDTGGEMPFGPMVADALRNNLWLLRIGSNGQYYICDPEDVQPLANKDYLACYLAKDPEAAVRAQIQKQPDIAARAMRYLAHLQIQRILAEPDTTLRAEALMPYFLARYYWNDTEEAQVGLAGCGVAAGPYLLGALENARDETVQDELMVLCGKTRYPGAIDLLINRIDVGNKFFAAQKLKPGWWNDDNDSFNNRYRQAEFGHVSAAVYALGRIGDPRARPIIKATRQLWASTNVGDPSLVKVCDEALNALDQQGK